MTDLAAAMAALAGKPPTGRGRTSDLTIDELLLLHSIGWEPCDVVFGVSWWSVPWGAWQWQTGEIAEASQAFAGAMSEASDRMRSECADSGGSGVVGVEIELSVRPHHIAVSLTGTAVRRIEHPSTGFDFLSDLSARDFVLLTWSGWEPLDLAAGASFVTAPRRSARQWAAQQGQNTELPHLTEALYQAREGAMLRMQESGLAASGDGVVNVKLREGPLGHNPRIMMFIGLGTTVRLRADEHIRIGPEMVVALDDTVRLFEAANLRRA